MSPEQAELDVARLAALGRDLRDIASRLVDALTAQPTAANASTPADVPESHPTTVPPTGSAADLISSADGALSQPPLDGLWIGAMPNGAYGLRLRLDREVSAKVSGDLACAGPHGFEWLWSFVTSPAERVLHGASGWEVRFEAPTGVIGRAYLSLAWISAEETMASLVLTYPPPGLPSDTALYIPLHREGPEMRSARLQTSMDTSDPDAVEVARTATARLLQAGIRTTLHASPAVVAEAPDNRGWGQAEILEAALSASVLVPLAPAGPPDIKSDLVLASMAARQELVSFILEPEPALGRRAIIVFHIPQGGVGPAVGEILHLLGASCGLLPHGDPRLPSPLSDSPMALQPGASDVTAGPFTPNELAHLRHAGISTLALGHPDSPEPYWLARHHQPPPPTFTTPPRHLRLEIAIPETGPVLALGQPLFLTVKLLNTGTQATEVDETLLDLKTGALSVTVAREGWSQIQALPRLFRPALRRRTIVHLATLAPGKALKANLQVGYGRDGIVLPEPGVYRIKIHLDLPTKEGAAARIEAPPLRLRVQDPLDYDAAREALELLDPQSGLYLALGGIRLLPKVADRLSKIAMQRDDHFSRMTVHRRRQSAGGGVVASVWRALAIDLGRAYPGLSAGLKEERLSHAVEIMCRFDEKLLAWLDPCTRNDFIDLRNKQQQRLATLGGPPLGAALARQPRRKAAHTAKRAATKENG